MKRALTIAASAVAILAACGGDSGPTATTSGSIRGTVTDNTGATVPNAAVELTGNGQAVRTTNTGVDGVYTFSAVPTGTYTVKVTPPTGFTIGAAATVTVTVASEAQVNASAFVLNRLSGNGSIKGTVADADAPGGGVANVEVALTGNGQAARTTNTGAGGAYTFADLPPGTYALAVTPPAGFGLYSGGTASVTVPTGAEANASTFILRHDSCLVSRPNFGGPATEADRALFAYDVNAPLNLQKTVLSTNNGVQVSEITYTSPGGGSVPGILAEPIGSTGPIPGVVAMHPSGFPTKPWAPYLALLAQKGAVVIAIDAPYFRRGGPQLRFIAADREEQIQLIKDLQRAVDILLATGKVDASRIGFEGYSFGGIVGAQFVGIEKRLKAAVLTAAHGGWVTGVTTQAKLPGFAATFTCAVRNAWFRNMIPIESIRFIPHASPTALFFQIAKFDTAVLPEDAQTLYDAAPNPKEVTYYETGHGLNLQAMQDKQAWLLEQLGIENE